MVGEEGVSLGTLQGNDETLELRNPKTGMAWALPVLKGTEGPDVIDITHLYRDAGYFTFDPGYLSTASCASRITYIDGEKGILRYAGYPIQDLAEHSDFMETAYLLLNGELPTLPQKEAFLDDLKRHTLLNEQVREFYRGFRHDAHPMAILIGVVGALSAFYHDMDVENPTQRRRVCHRLIAKMPTIAAMAYKYSIAQPFVYPLNSMSYAENLLHMMFATPAEPYVVNPVFTKALDRILILHADHEQNASTSTVRLAGSSGANPFACIAAGIAALWGPAHGGANEAVIHMLEEIGDAQNIPEFLDRVKQKSDGVRLMGFGHRVYKNYDPRAKVLRAHCYAVLEELGREDPLMDLALELEAIALEDPYFIERKLYPNVDFYSGLILRALGIPTSMFTVIFAVARTVGWVAQWQEMMDDPVHKIGRPRQLYIGYPERQYPV